MHLRYLSVPKWSEGKCIVQRVLSKALSGEAGRTQLYELCQGSWHSHHYKTKYFQAIHQNGLIVW